MRLNWLGWLLGAVLVAHAAIVHAQVPTVRFTVERFQVSGPNPLSDEETQRVVSPFAGEHEGLEGLLAAADALEAAIAKANVDFHRVVLVPQTLREGVVELKVVALKLSKVTVDGNEHFSDDNVLASLPRLEQGTSPSTADLARNLTLANEHPAKRMRVTFRESKEGEPALEADVRVEDSKPWQVFASLSNTGTDETGDWRVTAGAQYSNLFDRDHAITATYSTAPEQPSNARQLSVSYFAPVYAFDSSLLLYYVTSDVDSGTIGDFEVTGSGDFWGLRFTHLLRPIGRYNHRLVFGFDSKLFENDQTLFGVPIGVDVRSTPISVRYQGAYAGKGWQLDFYGEYARNIGFGFDNNKATNRANTGRTGTREHWDVLRGWASAWFNIYQRWQLHAVLEAQHGGEPLIPGEQFGIGGSNSVRGFDERESVGDDGIRATLEVWTPPLFRGLRALAFFDHGLATIKRSEELVAGTHSIDITSVGIGARWQWRDNAAFSLDIANVIDGNDTRGGGTKKAHLSLLFRY